jgi:hypothetical protein
MRLGKLPSIFAVFVLLTLSSGLIRAQSNPRSEQIAATYEAHQHEFDYLLGDWEITLRRPDLTRHGYWSAVRLSNGEILDDYRLVNDKGETTYASTTIRAFNAILDRWELISMIRGTGLQNVGTGHWEGNEMRIEQTINELGPNPLILRIRYHDIQPDHFLWNADESADGGKTWGKNRLQIEAKRIGPARKMGPLTPTKGPAMPGGGPSH